MRVSNRPILALAAATFLSACGADDAMLIAEILRGQQNPPGGETPAPPEGESSPPPADDPPIEQEPQPDPISDEQRAVQAILDVNCLACHGKEAGLGGFDSMDIDYLVIADHDRDGAAAHAAARHPRSAPHAERNSPRRTLHRRRALSTPAAPREPK
jgi:hypothetical protein